MEQEFTHLPTSPYDPKNPAGDQGFGLSGRPTVKVLGITLATAAMCLKRYDMQDRSYCAHTLHTTLSGANRSICPSMICCSLLGNTSVPAFPIGHLSPAQAERHVASERRDPEGRSVSLTSSEPRSSPNITWHRRALANGTAVADRLRQPVDLKVTLLKPLKLYNRHIA